MCHISNSLIIKLNILKSIKSIPLKMKELYKKKCFFVKQLQLHTQTVWIGSYRKQKPFMNQLSSMLQ